MEAINNRLREDIEDNTDRLVKDLTSQLMAQPRARSTARFQPA